MPVIKVNDQQYSLRPGQNRLGAGEGVDVSVAENGALGLQAIVEVGDDSQVVIRRAGDAAVRVNGVPLVDPTPLMHGDRLEIGGREIFYTDDSKSGATQYVSASEIASMAAKRAGPARATAATGGRLVSLVDGKEYLVPATGITMGRDATSGVVIAQNEVSRKHAEVLPVEQGYELRDHSANGVYVNGVRIEHPTILSRADVIRIGGEEFRFYADVAPAAPAPKAAAPAASTPPAAAPVVSAPVSAPVAAPVSAPAPAAAIPVAAPPVAAPVAPAAAAAAAAPATAAPATAAPAPVATPDARPLVAVLEVTNEGPTKGMTYDIRVPLAHVGRGAHNDVVINDDSVSDTHAKLQRRDDGWYVVDVGSTNGTYVAGQRINGERRLEGAPDLRFGGVKMVFRPRDVAADGGKGTRAIASVDRAALRTAAPATAPAVAPTAARAPQQTAPVAEPKPSSGLPGWVWGVVVLAIGAAVAFFLLNR